MWIFAESIATGRPMPLFGDGGYRRDFTHVSDICERTAGGARRRRTSSARRSTWAITSRSPIRELIALLEAALGRKAVIDRRPASPADLPITCADLTKARAPARLSSRKVALADGVREFAAWFRQVRGM